MGRLVVFSVQIGSCLFGRLGGLGFVLLKMGLKGGPLVCGGICLGMNEGSSVVVKSGFIFADKGTIGPLYEGLCNYVTAVPGTQVRVKGGIKLDSAYV